MQEEAITLGYLRLYYMYVAQNCIEFHNHQKCHLISLPQPLAYIHCMVYLSYATIDSNFHTAMKKVNLLDERKIRHFELADFFKRGLLSTLNTVTCILSIWHGHG